MENRMILVVDDDPDQTYVSRKRLTSSGFEVITATDGLDAIRVMLAHPDCRNMVTDFDMPILGGETWIRVLERFCNDWKIVVVSGQYNDDSGPFLCMPKPVDFSSLAAYFQEP